MRRTYALAVLFIVVAAATIIMLTSGISKGRYDGGRDLVEELYNQAVKQDKNLENIEDNIEAFYKKKREALEKYNAFTAYNNRYYDDARSNAGSIASANTKQKANDIITTSEARYKTQMADWENKIATLNTNEKELRELHTLLMITITEPMIKKYQSTELPDNSKAKEVNNDLLNILERIKAITK